MLRYVRNTLLILILLVHIGCIFIYYQVVLNSDKNHRVTNEFHESEVDFQLNDDRPNTDFLVTSTETLAKTTVEKEPQPIADFKGIYVREAYRVSDTEIRLVYLAKNDNRTPLKAFISSEWKEFKWFCCNYTTCIDYEYCSMAPRIGILHVSNNFSHNPVLQIAPKYSNENFRIPLNDVRGNEKKEYEHILGVCLQPIFFLTDWTVFIQFFESWITQGATKFYIYVHSYSRQVNEVLKFYKEQLGQNLEIILWSNLPVPSINRGDYWKDPNAHVFRHGATAFMHDCMLKSRYSVKFISNSDLDDFPVSKNMNIAKTMQDISSRHPDAGQFILDWYLSEQKQNWDMIHNPSHIFFNLTDVRVLRLENVRFDYSISKKIIHRPERVLHFDQHNVFGNEKMSNGKHYTAVEMFGNSDLYFLHLRRFERLFINPKLVRFNESFDFSALRKLNAEMSKNYSKRIDGRLFKKTKMSPWTLEARETMRNLEQCRLEAFGSKLTSENEMCRQSSAGCSGMLTADVQFIRAPMTWINVAQQTEFNTYTETRNELHNITKTRT